MKTKNNDETSTINRNVDYKLLTDFFSLLLEWHQEEKMKDNAKQTENLIIPSTSHELKKKPLEQSPMAQR